MPDSGSTTRANKDEEPKDYTSDKEKNNNLDFRAIQQA